MICLGSILKCFVVNPRNALSKVQLVRTAFVNTRQTSLPLVFPVFHTNYLVAQWISSLAWPAIYILYSRSNHPFHYSHCMAMFRSGRSCVSRRRSNTTFSIVYASALIAASCRSRSWWINTSITSEGPAHHQGNWNTSTCRVVFVPRRLSSVAVRRRVLT